MSRQVRGTHPHTLRLVAAYLSANPGSTTLQVCVATGLSRQTVQYTLPRVGVSAPGPKRESRGSNPRHWVLRPDLDVDLLGVTQEVAPLQLSQTWSQWEAIDKWPGVIARMRKYHDPRDIAGGLEALAANAARLAMSFRAVQDEPDWETRLGKVVNDGH